jgi:hypothetical protein
MENVGTIDLHLSGSGQKMKAYVYRTKKASNEER